MDLPTNILVPTDFSECSQEALDYALKLAARLDAKLCIMHAYLVPVASWEGAWAFPEDVMQQLEAASRRKLDETLSKARETRPTASAKFIRGDARDAIVQLATELKADLIIMGSHSRRGLSRALLGSVTEAIVRRAPCAVLAFRHPKDM